MHVFSWSCFSHVCMTVEHGIGGLVPGFCVRVFLALFVQVRLIVNSHHCDDVACPIFYPRAESP